MAAVLVVAGGSASYGIRDPVAEAVGDVSQYERSSSNLVQGLRRQASGGDAESGFAVIGDSYAQGIYLENPLDAYPYRLQSVGTGSVVVDGSGGTGSVAAGPCSLSDPSLHATNRPWKSVSSRILTWCLRWGRAHQFRADISKCSKHWTIAISGPPLASLW